MDELENNRAAIPFQTIDWTSIEKVEYKGQEGKSVDGFQKARVGQAVTPAEMRVQGNRVVELQAKAQPAKP